MSRPPRNPSRRPRRRTRRPVSALWPATGSWNCSGRRLQSDGGAPITHYQYEQDGVWQPAEIMGASYRVTGLTNDQTYTFRVRAVNHLGMSTASNSASATPTADPMPPDTPSDLVARPGHESVRLSWNQAGAIVTRYEYELDGSGVWIATDSTDKSYTVRGLNNRQLYRFKVRGVNDDGNGPASAEAQATPNAQPPDPPTDLKAVAGDGQVTLTWKAPESDGGTAITHYQYEQNGNWHSTVPRDSTETSYTVTGLTNQRTYRFRVQAFNESQAGPSKPSDVASAMPTGPTPPGAPTGLSAVAGDGRVELSWTAPVSDGGFRITGYEYEQNGSGDWVPTRSTADQPHAEGPGERPGIHVPRAGGQPPWVGRPIRPVATRHAGQGAGRADGSERRGRRRTGDVELDGA